MSHGDTGSVLRTELFDAADYGSLEAHGHADHLDSCIFFLFLFYDFDFCFVLWCFKAPSVVDTLKRVVGTGAPA